MRRGAPVLLAGDRNNNRARGHESSDRAVVVDRAAMTGVAEGKGYVGG